MSANFDNEYEEEGIPSKKDLKKSSREKKCDYNFKIILLGDSGAGKTSILERYVDNDFSGSKMATIGVDFRKKRIEFENLSIMMDIWDTAGQERYASIVSLNYRGAHGVILVYDITNKESFLTLKKRWDDAQQYIDEDVFIILIGNKLDMSSNRSVSLEMASEFAKQHNMEFGEVSAKDNYNISSIFTTCVTQIMSTQEQKQKQNEPQNNHQYQHQRQKQTVDVNQQTSTSHSSGFCC